MNLCQISDHKTSWLLIKGSSKIPPFKCVINFLMFTLILQKEATWDQCYKNKYVFYLYLCLGICLSFCGKCLQLADKNCQKLIFSF